MNRTELNVILKELSEKELRELVTGLHSLNSTNAYYISIFLKSSENPDIIALCSQIKNKLFRIYNANPNYRNINIKMNLAKNIVKESETAFKEFPVQLAEIYFEFCLRTLLFLKRFGLINMIAVKLIIGFYEKAITIVNAASSSRNELKLKSEEILNQSKSYDEFLFSSLEILAGEIE